MNVVWLTRSCEDDDVIRETTYALKLPLDIRYPFESFRVANSLSSVTNNGNKGGVKDTATVATTPAGKTKTPAVLERHLPFDTYGSAACLRLREYPCQGSTPYFPG